MMNAQPKYRKERFSITDSTEDSENIQRETWTRKTEYLLSMIGYCVGLGNIWRFPYICMRNGGGAFLIPFLIFLLTAGLPLYFLEVSIAQFIGKGLLTVWEVCPLFKGIGVCMIFSSLVISLYYNIITTWVIYYIVNSFFNPLPWSTCTNDWNTKDCVSDSSGVNITNIVDKTYSVPNNNGSNLSESFQDLSPHSISVSNTSHAVTSEEEFWQNKVLQMSSGLDDLGYIPWHLPVCYLAAWIVIFFSIIKGVRSVGKVVFVTATLPYVILTVLLIRGLTLPGGVDGIVYYLKPDFNRLLDIQVWLEAGLQVFYSLGPCWGGLITMSSYNKFDNNCLRDAVLLTLIAEGTSIYGGMAVFSILGYMALKVKLPINEVVQSGPGLGFIAYPEAISQLPIPNLWAILFFVMLLTAALDSMFVNVEILCASVLESFPVLRKRQPLLTGAVCITFFLLGLPLCTQGGVYIFQLLDWYVGALSVMTLGLLECIIFGWIYGIERFSRDVALMIGRPIPVLLRVCVSFLTPALLMTTFILTLLSYRPPNYGSYQYPCFAQIIGWTTACIPICPLAVYAILELRKARGNSIYDKLCFTLRPTPLWQPNSKNHEREYDNEDREFKVPFPRRLKLNIFG